jgi:uncharacterized protein YbjQ (UPF0145 family)
MMSAGETRMTIATTDGIAGHRTVVTLDLVLGLAIRSRGLSGNIMAGLDAHRNAGALDEYRDSLLAVRAEAIAQMVMQARNLGANAIVGVRFDTAAAGHDMSEIVAYGTAVVIEREV